MSIYKLASKFAYKIAQASNNNLENIKKLYQAAKALNNMKKLFSTATENPYGGEDPDIEKAVDLILSIAAKGYNQAVEHGMSASGQYSYAGFLTDMEKGVQRLETEGPFPKLDPKAAQTLDLLKQALKNARTEFQPVAIPSKKQSPKTDMEFDPDQEELLETPMPFA